MPTFGDLEGKTYGEIAQMLAAPLTLEQRVAKLEEAMRQIYPHAHCHPEDCPHPVEANDRQQDVVP